MLLAEDCAFAFGQPELAGVIRSTPEDFVVNEQFAFTFDGVGEHTLLQIRKRNTNTEWLARQLAQLAGVRKVDVSYAGLKDRNAVTTQWFSVWLPGKPDPDWSRLASDEVQVLQVQRHGRKLRRGSLSGNQFVIQVRDLHGDVTSLASRLQHIKTFGVPNYFGVQRFGHDNHNLVMAEKMFNGLRIKDRFKKSMYISAARSLLFNHYLEQRVQMHCWHTAVPGDVLLLDNSRSYFVLQEMDASIEQRLADFDIHPSGPLWGRGRLATQDQALAMESALAQTYPSFCHGLEHVGLEQERRALRLPVRELQWQLHDAERCLELSFFLPAGGYATSVLREIVRVGETTGAD